LPRQGFPYPKVINIPLRYVFGFCRIKELITYSVLVSKLLNVGGTGVGTADPSHWLVLYAADKQVFKMLM
jgi:hypothetical protein